MADQTIMKSPNKNRGKVIMLISAVAVLIIPTAIGFAIVRRPRQTQNEPEITNPLIAPIGNFSEEAAADLFDQSSTSQSLNIADDTEELAYSRIKVLIDNSPVPVTNGGLIPNGEDMKVEIFISPYPPTGFNVDVDFYITTADDEPIVDAEIFVEYDMMFMLHGPFFTSPKSLNNGHYISSYDFYMYGPWVLETFITAPSYVSSSEIPISIYVWPEG